MSKETEQSPNQKIEDKMDAYDLHLQGKVLMEEGKLSEAAIQFERAAEASPHFKSLEYWGECLLKLGDAKRAIIPLAAATALNKQIRAKSMLAKALIETGEERIAQEIARQVLVEYPTNRIAKHIVDNTSAMSDE